MKQIRLLIGVGAAAGLLAAAPAFAADANTEQSRDQQSQDQNYRGGNYDEKGAAQNAGAKARGVGEDIKESVNQPSLGDKLEKEQQAKAAQPSQEKLEVSGKVADVSPVKRELAVLDQNGKFIHVFHINRASDIKLGDNSVSLGKIPPGSDVRVSYSIRNNEMLAEKVEAQIGPTTNYQETGAVGSKRELKDAAKQDQKPHQKK